MYTKSITDEDFEPQSNEEQVSVADTWSRHQTVTFSDTHPGYEMATRSELDPVSGEAYPDDVPLDQFFSRPIKIFDASWPVNGLFTGVFSPWNEYFSNPRIANRISNYRMMRANLRVKFMINGTPFHYGRVLAAYYPLPDEDSYTLARTGIIQDVVEASQRPHVWLDPTNSQGGELLLPFFWPENGIDLPTARFDALGEIVFHIVNPLEHALGKTGNVPIAVYAWAEDVKLAIPTEQDVGSISPQGNEYASGPVSRPATTVAKAAGIMSKMPVIGPFAKATQMAANAVAGIASIFGYSNPPNLEVNMYRPVAKGNLAVSSGLDDVTKLTLDPKSETTLDTRPFGLSGDDEMIINSIAKRESYLTTFTWAEDANSGALLWNSVVDPCLRANNDLEFHLPACAYVALPFKYWRGTMKFRFQVICSKYHKGRLAIVYDPVRSVSTTDFSTDLNYTTIVDISDKTDFTVEVGWGQTTTYRQHAPILSPGTQTDLPQSSLYANAAAIPYQSTTEVYGNGVIKVHVLNELVTPDASVTAPVSVNVLVSMSDDFDVGAPCAEDISVLTTSAPSRTFDIVPQAMEMEPQADEGDQGANGSAPAEEKQRMDSSPESAPVVAKLGPDSPIDHTNDIYFGEKIVSLRQVLKRYNLHEVMVTQYPESFTGGASEYFVSRHGREAMPFEPMWVTDNTPGSLLVVPTLAGDLLYANMTLMRYFALGFAGWRGSIRRMVDFSPHNYGGTMYGPMSVSWRQEPCANYSNGSTWDDFNSILGKQQYYGSYNDNEGMNGTAITHDVVNKIISVEVPYFTEFKFAPARAAPRVVTDVLNNTSLSQERGKTYFEIIQTSVSKANGTKTAPGCHSWVAAGEDFNLLYYQAPPIFYRFLYPSS